MSGSIRTVHPGGQDQFDRELEARGEQINAILGKLGLKPFGRLGDRRNGEWEILSYVGHTANQYFAVVTFLVLTPWKETRPYNMIFNATHPEVDGAIVVPIVGDKIVTLRQHRATLLDIPGNGWLEEFPRGFALNGDTYYLRPQFREEAEVIEVPEDAALATLGSIPLQIVGTELRPLMESGQARLVRVIRLDDTPENSGTSRVVVPVYAAMFLADADVRVRGTRQCRIKMHALEDLRRDRRQIGLRDQASLAALFLLEEYMREHPGALGI